MLKRSRYRKHVIEELIKTEETYVRDLTLLQDSIVKELKTNKILTDEEIKSLFINL